jgi:hypothetical protein
VLGHEGERRREGEGASLLGKNQVGGGLAGGGLADGGLAGGRVGGDAEGAPIYAKYSRWDF